MFEGLLQTIRDFAGAVLAFFWGEYDARVIALRKDSSSTVDIPDADERESLVNQAVKGLRERTELDDEILEEFDEIAKLPWLPRLIAWGYASATVIGAKLGAWSRAMGARRAQLINADLRPDLLDASTLAAHLWRFPGQSDSVPDLLDRNGLPNEQQEILLRLSRQYPALGELLVLVNRGFMEPEQAEAYLKAQGYDEPDARNLLKLRDFFPSPQDIVTLAGREAFEEDSIERFGLDRDMPDELFEVAAQAGIPRKVIRWFWVAHWNNPSLNQIFQMIHRGVRKPDGSVFDQDDLDIYFRLADVNPFFGRMLQQIAYSPLTRVDIRRFYERGIIDRETVTRSYLALGYSPEDAEIQTQFADYERDTFGRDLSRTQLERLYKQGAVTTEELRSRYDLLGYDERETDLLVQLLRTDVAQDRLDAAIGRLEVEFKAGARDVGSTEAQLVGLGMTDEAKRLLVQQWRDEQIADRTLPSREDLTRWLTAGRIDPAEFRETMRLRGYSEADIDRYEEEA